MSVELSYRIVNLSRRGSHVLMVLEELRTVPPEEITRARKEAEAESETDVVDEGEQLAKIKSGPPPPEDPMRRMIWAWKQEFPGLVEAFKTAPPPMGGGGRMMRAVPISFSHLMEMLVTTEQYVELGSPPLLAVIQIALSV